jgi:hypothetical protein
MKALYQSLSILALLALFFTPGLLRAQDDSGNDDQGVSFQTFYDQLGDQGTWVQTDDYGYVWQPNVQDPDWAPYSDGHWVYTDDGWTWVSDESWGWATYHYGRWANIDGMGWIWVPGYRWAPAWVSWRYGGGYCGWAPLPPETIYGAEYGDSVGADFHFGGDVDLAFHIGPGCYNFLPVGNMGDRSYRHSYLNRNNNFAIINRTTNITNVNVHQGGGHGFRGVSVAGPSVNEVNSHSRQQVQRANLTAANQPGRSTLQGNSLAVYAPRVNAESIHQARPSAVSQTLNHPNFNRGDSVSRPLEVTRTLAPPPATPEAIRAAEDAQTHAPANARVANANTPIKNHLDQPLTSLQPVEQPHHEGNGIHNPAASSTGGGVQNQTHVITPTTQNQGNAESHHPATDATPRTFQPQTQNNTENQQQRSTESSPQIFQPQTQNNPENQHHPHSTTETTPQVFHPQTQPNPNTENSRSLPPSSPPAEPSVRHSDAPSQSFHPQNQNNGGGNGGGSQGGGGGTHTFSPPATSQPAPSHPAPPPAEPTPAPSAPSAPSTPFTPSGGGGGGGGQGGGGGDHHKH